MEAYRGVKFRYRMLDRKIPDAARFLEIDRKLVRFLSPGANEGNMSMRTGGGFLVKGAGAKMTCLTVKDVSFVSGVEGCGAVGTGTPEELEECCIVLAAGAVPSSETMMHFCIYRARPDAAVILHFHDDGMLAWFDGPAIGPFGYGTKEQACAAGKIAGKYDFFMLREHGFVAIAESADGIFEALTVNQKQNAGNKKMIPGTPRLKHAACGKNTGKTA